MRIFKQIITAAILLAPVVGIAAPKTSSSERNMAFIRFLGTDNGFSGASVNWLHQDSHGYLWIGSIDGLVRYDGVNSQLYKKEDLHTGSSAVSSVYEDGGGQHLDRDGSRSHQIRLQQGTVYSRHGHCR